MFKCLDDMVTLIERPLLHLLYEYFKNYCTLNTNEFDSVLFDTRVKYKFTANRI